MDVVLITLGIMGFGAILISAYVFTVAARNYVTDDNGRYRKNSLLATSYQRVERSATDRRSGQTVEFPLTVNGILITHDRRILPERRLSA